MAGTRVPPAVDTGAALSVGPFTLSVVDGDVRDVRFAGVPVVQHVYAAVRGTDWATAAVEPVDERTDVVDGALEHRVRAVHRLPDGAVDARLDVRGGPGGRLVWDLELRPRGRVGEGVAVNRAGLCVLLPDRAAAGRTYRAVPPSGPPVTGRLPFAAGPQRIVDGVIHGLFPAFRGLTVALDGAILELAIEGGAPPRPGEPDAELELEDQRNWTETSFKAYTRSLRRPFPYRPGAAVRQRVSVRVRPAGRARRSRPAPAGVLRTPAALPLRRPPLGAELPPGPPPGPDVVAALTALHLDHLHVDARADPGVLDPAARVAAALGAGLEVAVEDTAPLPAAPAAAPLHRVLVSRDGGPPPPGLGDRHTALGPDVPLFAAAVGDFAALNRTFDAHPPRRAAFGASPQVHLTDDRTVLECARGLHAAVLSARHAGVREVVAAPVSLGRRATGAGARPAPDARLDGPVGTAWAAAALVWLIAARAWAVTLLATHGDAGLLTGDRNGVRTRPVAAVVAAVGALPVGTPAAVVAEPDGGPLVAAVFAPAPDRRRWLLVNPSTAPRTAVLAAGPAAVRHLDPTGAWRPAEATRGAGGTAVDLPPCGVVLVDAGPAR